YTPNLSSRAFFSFSAVLFCEERLSIHTISLHPFQQKETPLLEETSLHILNETSSLFRSSLPAQIARRGKEADQHADHNTGSDLHQADEQRKRPDRLQGKQVGKQATADHIIKPRITYHGQDARNDRTDQTDQYTFHHER